MSNFSLGKIVMTSGVNDMIFKDEEFAKGVILALKRYVSNNWGDLCDEDKALNEDAIKHGDRLFARYKINPDIYIITEWDRSVTTILFPEEY